ncbi:TetR/AcrR family transcriptional regulator [Microbacterium halotolerans]|uniref:TetR/AcrR family transcriptional regulator n=1 Tax=Microbacterium halotolerans TaxID=246613 RepID=UPI000E6ACE37|nr:TetR/AcrR family transcriptional regulator [Microbacterium halotolerans]
MSSAEDRTTRARIRDAGVAAFAAGGFSRTTIRGIAQAAGVSPGLVIHHFGSKDGLRRECDDYVFTAIFDAKRGAAPQAAPDAIASMFRDERMHTIVEYLVKSLLDPSEHGQRHFDHYVDLVEELLGSGFAGYSFRHSDDNRAQAAMVAVLALTPMMLQHRLQSVLGTQDTASTLARLSQPLLDLYMRGIIVDSPNHTDADGTTDSATTAPAEDPDAPRDERRMP